MFRVVDIIKKYSLSTKKKFGQNFLVDESLLDKIVTVAGDITGKNVLEIGPGPGGLTYSILKMDPKKLTSIEIDKDLYGILKMEFGGYKNFEVVDGDALKIDETEFFDSEKINVIANLPYNVGTTLLIKWLNNLQKFDSFTLLLQKEVVDRIVAKPFSKDYGRLSILVQALCDAKKAFDVKPTCFLPPPKVISSVVHITPKKIATDVDINKLSYVTMTLFNQRRKKVKKVMEGLVACGKVDRSILTKIDLEKRAEELSVEEFIDIAKATNGGGRVEN